MKRKNIAAMVTSIALVGVVAVGGTLALLTQKTDTLKNTFTVGSGYADNAFNLYEHKVELITTDAQAASKGTGYKVGDYAEKSASDKVYANDVAAGETANDYDNVIPGATLDKDPTFDLTTGSPASWVVARVNKEELYNLQEAGITVSEVAAGSKWHVVTPEGASWSYGNTVSNASFTVNASDKEGYLYFVYEDPIGVNGVNETQPLFTKLTATSDPEELDAMTDKPLNIQGVAVQKLGTDTTPEAAIKAIMTDATNALNQSQSAGQQ